VKQILIRKSLNLLSLKIIHNSKQWNKTLRIEIKEEKEIKSWLKRSNKREMLQ